MFKLKFKDGSATVEVTFDSYMDMVYYVAKNRVKDEDLISINFNGMEIDGGIDGLCNFVTTSIDEYRAAEAAAKMMAEITAAMVNALPETVEDEEDEPEHDEEIEDIISEIDSIMEDINSISEDIRRIHR